MKKFLCGFSFLLLSFIINDLHGQSVLDPVLIQVPNVPPAITEAFESDFGWYLDQLDQENIFYEIWWFRLVPAGPFFGWPLEFGGTTTVMLFDGDEAHHFGVRYRSTGDLVTRDVPD